MIGDGNCFYRAVAAAYYKDVTMHPTLRFFTMDHMLDSADVYQHFFESFMSMKRRLTANKRLGVWNTDLADLVPFAISRLLQCRLEIYAVTDDEEVLKHSFGESGDTIRLLYKNNHYDLLVKN